MSNHKVLLSLTEAQHAALKKHSTHVGISLSAQIRLIIQQHLDKVAPKVEAKPDPKAHLREAYNEHLATLERSIVVNPDRGPIWQNKLRALQKAWGADGAIVLPFPVEQWNSMANPNYKPTAAPTDETQESIEEDLRKLFEDLDD